jgi:hypothetical protein
LEPGVLRRALEQARSFFRKYGPWGATAIIILVFALEHSDSNDIPLELVLLSTSVVLVFSQLEQSNKELSKAIKENLRESAKITNAVIPRLFSLEECLNDLTERVHDLTQR